MPSPEHGASTSTRSILPARRLTRSSRSCAICTGVHVRQPAARHARLDRVEPMARGVERIQAPGVAHRRAQRQRLATGAGAEVHHHLAALGVEQRSKQLAAFILHLEMARSECWRVQQRGPSRHAQTPWAVARGRDLKAELQRARAARRRVWPSRCSRAGPAVRARAALASEPLELGRHRADAATHPPANRAGCGAACQARQRAVRPPSLASHCTLVRLERGLQGARIALPSQPAPGGAPAARCRLAPGAAATAAGAAPHTPSRPAHGGRAAPSARWRRKCTDTTASAGCSKRSTARSSSAACCSSAFGCIGA